MADRLISLNEIKDIVTLKIGTDVKWVESEPSEDGIRSRSGFNALVPATEEIAFMFFDEVEGFNIVSENDTPVKVYALLFNTELVEQDGNYGVLVSGALNGALVIDDVTVTKDDLALIGITA